MMQVVLDALRAPEPAIMVLAPLIGAALTASMPGPRAAWLAATLSALVAAAAAILGANSLAKGETATGVAAFAAPLIACCAAAVVVASGALLKDFSDRAAPFALALILVMSGSWSAALHADRWIGVFLAVETASVACVGVVALSAAQDRGALNGALRLFGMSGAAAGLFLLGAGLIWWGTGAATLHGLSLAAIRAPTLTLLGVSFVLISVSLRAALAPMHGWAGAVFSRGGHAAVLAVAAINCVGALAVVLHLGAHILPAPALGAGASTLLGVLGAISVVVGSVQSIGAKNLRRLGAYAATAQAGCVLLGAALGSIAGYAAALVQLVAYAGAVVALQCAAAGAPGARANAMETMDGFGRRSPLAGAAVAAAALSFMGAPLTAGFLGRWQLMEAGIGGGAGWVAAAGVGASLAGVFYGGRLIERLYFRRASATARPAGISRVLLAPALIFGMAATAIGVAPEALLRAAAHAASGLGGPAP